MTDRETQTVAPGRVQSGWDLISDLADSHCAEDEPICPECPLRNVCPTGIEAKNVGSIELHKKLGFDEVGLLPEVGTKFGQWLDLAFLQLKLDSRTDPDEDAHDSKA